MDNCIDNLGEAQMVPALDALWKYRQVPIKRWGQEKPTLISQFDPYSYSRIPFCLRNASVRLQRALDTILSRLLCRTCLLYIHEVSIFSKNSREHVKDIHKILASLRQAKLTLTVPKCHLFKKKFEYLGRTITLDCLTAAFRNVDAFKSAVFLTDSTQLRSFMDPCNMFRRFIKSSCKIARSLGDYLLTSKELDWLDPTTEARDTLNTIKSGWVQPLVVALLQGHIPYVINIYASAHGLVAVLFRQQNEINLNVCAKIDYCIALWKRAKYLKTAPSSISFKGSFLCSLMIGTPAQKNFKMTTVSKIMIQDFIHGTTRLFLPNACPEFAWLKLTLTVLVAR